MSGEIRRAPDADDPAAARGIRDEVPPSGSGLFRRLAPREGSSVSVVMSGLDLAFAPSHRNARDEVQRQRTAGARDPSDTDPPGDGEHAEEGRVAAPGRRGTPFSGFIVLRRRA